MATNKCYILERDNYIEIEESRFKKHKGQGKIERKIFYENGYKKQIFEGYFVNGKLNGKEKRTNWRVNREKGHEYEGNFKDEKLHGKAKKSINFTDGFVEIQEGTFEEGKAEFYDEYKNKLEKEQETENIFF